MHVAYINIFLLIQGVYRKQLPYVYVHTAKLAFSFFFFSKLPGLCKYLWLTIPTYPFVNRFLSEDVPHSKNVALLSVMYQYSGSQEKAEGIRGVYTREHTSI